MKNRKEKKNKVLYLILILLVILIVIGVLIYFKIIPISFKKNDFDNEIRKIYNQSYIDFTKDSNESEGIARTYCSGSLYGYQMDSCDKKLDTDSLAAYYVEMDKYGNIIYIAVGDENNVFGTIATVDSEGNLISGLNEDNIGSINSDYYKSTKEIGFRTKDFKMHLTTEEEVRKDVTITFVEESLYE